MDEKKRLIVLAVFLVIGIGAVAYTWYPRLFPPKKAPVRPPVQILEAPKPIEVPAQKAISPAAPASPVSKALREPEKAKPAEARPRAPTPARFGLEFPPFVIAAEADECEQRLKQDGLTTVRSVTHIDDGLYAVRVGPFPSAAKASEAMAELKAKPGAQPSEPEAPREFFFDDGPYNLREAVQRALEIKGKGYKLRIVQVEGKAPIYRIRTATQLDTAQATKLSDQYREAGCPNRVVAAR